LPFSFCIIFGRSYLSPYPSAGDSIPHNRRPYYLHNEDMTPSVGFDICQSLDQVSLPVNIFIRQTPSGNYLYSYGYPIPFPG